MTTLLLHWVNDTLCLSRPVVTLEEGFSNGYLFGEIFYIHNHQKDFASFVDKDVPDARLLNFCLLEPTFALLNIKFNSQIAKAVMRQQPGVTTKLLYQIKVTLESMEVNRLISEPQEDRDGIVRLMNTSMRSNKDQARQADHHHFEKQLRTLIGDNKSAMMSRALRQYEDAGKAYEEGQLNNKAEDRMYEEWVVQERRRSAKYQLESRRSIEQARNQELLAQYRINRARKFEREQRDERFRQQERQRNEQKQLQVRQAEKSHMEVELAQFEEKLESSSSNTANSVAESTDSTSKSSIIYEGQRQTFLNRTVMQKESEEYMSQLHQKFREQDKWAAAREKRRRKFLTSLSSEFKQEAEAFTYQFMESSLFLKCKLEIELDDELKSIAALEKVFKENRDRQDQQNAERRRADIAHAIESDRSLYNIECTNLVEDVKQQQIEYKHSQQERADAAHASAMEFCGEVVKELLDLAIDVMTLREEIGPVQAEHEESLIPREAWQELKFYFLSTFAKDKQAQKAEWLEKAFTHYAHTGSFLSTCLPALGCMQQQQIIGDYLRRLRLLVNPLPPPPPLPPVHRFPLKIAILGRPFTGKTKLARALAEKYGLIIINSSDLVAFAVESAASVEKSQDLSTDSPPELEERRKLWREHVGLEVSGFRSQGLPLPNELYVKMVLLRVNEINQERKSQDTNSRMTSRANDPLEHNRGGWVLLGFPETLLQARLLQMALTSQDEDTHIPVASDRDSLIVPGAPLPPPGRERFTPDKSGLDLVFHIEQPQLSYLLFLALGRRKDPKTGMTYHLTMNPPPMDEVMKYRLVPIDCPESPNAQLAVKIASHDYHIGDISHLYRKYGIWKTIPMQTSAKEDEAFCRVDAEVRKLLNDRMEIRKADHTSKLAQIQAAKRARRLARLQYVSEERKLAQLRSQLQAATTALATAQQSKANKDQVKGLTAECEQLSAKLAEVQTLCASLKESASRAGGGTIEGSGGNETEADDKALAELMLASWDIFEINYIDTCKSSLLLLQKEQNSIVKHFRQQRERFAFFLQRKDEKQQLLTAFQTAFNTSLSLDMRFDDDIKAELHQRVDELGMNLLTISEKRQADCQGEIEAIRTAGWIEVQAYLLLVIYLTFAQQEFEKLRVSAQYLRDSTARFSLRTDLSERQPATCQIDYSATGSGGQAVGEAKPCSNLLSLFQSEYREKVDALITGNGSPLKKVARSDSTGRNTKLKADIAPKRSSTAGLDSSGGASPPQDKVDTQFLSVEDALQVFKSVLHNSFELTAKLALPVESKDSQTSGNATGKDKPATGAAGKSKSDVRESVVAKPLDPNSAEVLIGAAREEVRTRVEGLERHAAAAIKRLVTKFQGEVSLLEVAAHNRANSEMTSMAGLLESIRAAIEKESELPHLLLIEVQPVYRFPPLLALPADTATYVDQSRRLAPVPPKSLGAVAGSELPSSSEDPAVNITSIYVEAIEKELEKAYELASDEMGHLRKEEARAVISRWAHSQSTAVEQVERLISPIIEHFTSLNQQELDMDTCLAAVRTVLPLRQAE